MFPKKANPKEKELIMSKSVDEVHALTGIPTDQPLKLWGLNVTTKTNAVVRRIYRVCVVNFTYVYNLDVGAYPSPVLN